MSASPSVESCTHRIVSLEPFVLECGHYPDVDFRGMKQVGDKLACIGCYKGLPAGTPGRPETEVSPETQALLEANKPSSERCPGCGGVMVPGTPGKGKKPATPARCAKNCYLGNLHADARNRVLMVMREIADEASKYTAEVLEYRNLSVDHPMSEAEFFALRDVRQAFYQALRNGENPNRACEEAKLAAHGLLDSDAEFLKQRIAYAVHSDAKPPDTLCSLCGEHQFEPPSGTTCKNGHGGAKSKEEWISIERPIPDCVDVTRSMTELNRLERLAAKSKITPEWLAEVARDAQETEQGTPLAMRPTGKPMPSQLQALTSPASAPNLTPVGAVPSLLDDQRPRLAQATHESAQALAIARDAQVRSPEALEWAGGSTKYAKDMIDYLDAEREKLTRPLLDQKNKVDEVFMPAIKNWREVERDLKSKIGQYHGAQRAEQERVMRESAQVYQQGGIPVAPVPVVVSTDGVGVREAWSFEIVNPVLVPRELCSPDPEKIELRRAVVMSTSNEPPSIPGIKFYRTTQVRVTRR